MQYLVRRIDGQDHPDPNYKPAAAIAWTGLKTIEFMSKAFISGNLSDVRRLILHEKAHFLWEYTFDKKTKDDWAEIGGWFEDPTSGQVGPTIIPPSLSRRMHMRRTQMKTWQSPLPSI